MLSTITLSSAVAGVGLGVGPGGEVAGGPLAVDPVGAGDSLGVVEEHAAAAKRATANKVRDRDRIAPPSRCVRSAS
jgi:hypothetical protein